MLQLTSKLSTTTTKTTTTALLGRHHYTQSPPSLLRLYHSTFPLYFSATKTPPTSATKKISPSPPLPPKPLEAPKPAPHTVYKRRIKESLTVTSPTILPSSNNNSPPLPPNFGSVSKKSFISARKLSYVERNQLALQQLEEQKTQQKLQVPQTTQLTKTNTTTEQLNNLHDDDETTFFTKIFGAKYPQLLQCLSQPPFKIQKPSSVQRLVIPELLKGQDVLCAAQTGTGKTLSYVLPMLIRMKNDENERKKSLKNLGDETSENLLLLSDEKSEKSEKLEKQRPKFVILVPSRELVTQVSNIIKQVGHFLKLRCVALRSDLENARMKRDLNSRVDVVVSTPGVFVKMHQKGALYLSRVKYVVVDEADTLLSKDFKQELTENVLLPIRDKRADNFDDEMDENLGEKQKKRNARNGGAAQFCFVLATLNQEIQQYVSEYFPRMKLIAAPKLHYHHKNIQQRFITVPGHDKIKHLLPLIHGENSENRTMIFCSTVNSCRAVHYALKEAGISGVSCYHSEIPPEKQAEEFESFVRGESHIMVCTDLASRGLDILSVKHVIMFDFPLNTVDYLHRVGRTGRFGASGRVTSLVNRPREIALAKEIEKRIQSNQSLEGVSSNPKDRIIPGGAGQQRSGKKGSAVLGQKQAQKGKRALYWERQKLKEKMKMAKMQSRLGRAAARTPRHVKPIGAKGGASGLALDAISIPNPQQQQQQQK